MRLARKTAATPETTGRQRAAQREASARDFRAALYAETPPAGPPSRQVHRRRALLIRKAAERAARQAIIRGRRQKRPA